MRVANSADPICTCNSDCTCIWHLYKTTQTLPEGVQVLAGWPIVTPTAEHRQYSKQLRAWITRSTRMLFKGGYFATLYLTNQCAYANALYWSATQGNQQNHKSKNLKNTTPSLNCVISAFRNAKGQTPARAQPLFNQHCFLGATRHVVSK